MDGDTIGRERERKGEEVEGGRERMGRGTFHEQFISMNTSDPNKVPTNIALYLVTIWCLHRYSRLYIHTWLHTV